MKQNDPVQYLSILHLDKIVLYSTLFFLNFPYLYKRNFTLLVHNTSYMEVRRMAQGQSRSSNTLVAPEAADALTRLKFEVAQELGIQIPQDGYMGYVATRDTGAIGGHMVRRLVQIAEEAIARF